MILVILEIFPIFGKKKRKKKHFNYNEKWKFFLEQKNFDGLLPILWTGHAGVRRRGRWAGRRAGVRGAQGWRAWGAGLACVGRWAGVRGTLGRGARQAGSASGRRAGARGMRGMARGVRGRGAAGRAELARHRRGARGHARPGRGLGAWAWAVHSVHSAHFRSVLTRFFFLSHQMNTVHCKIKFFRKKKYLLNSNKIK